MLENITTSEIKSQFQRNKTLRLVSYIVGGLFVLALGYLLYYQFVKKPKNEKSKDLWHVSLNYASQDSTDLAIAEASKFLKKYDGTVGGENAQIILASQLMEKGKFSEALKQLQGCDFDDTFLKIYAIGLQGDCYSEMKKYKEAADYYTDAANTNKNEKTTPEYLFKAGLCAMKVNDFATAESIFIQIRDNYAAFSSQKSIEKYIARASRK